MGKKAWIWIGIALAILVIGWIVYRQMKKKTGQTGTDGEKIDQGSGLKSLGLTPASFPLQKGSKGKEVLFLQAYFNKFEKQDLALDGDFGTKTDLALMKSPLGVLGKDVKKVVYDKTIKPQETILLQYLAGKGIAP